MTRLRVLLSAALALGLVLLGGLISVPASAHTPNVGATCEQLVVTLTNYQPGGTNHVKVSIDGTVLEDVDFGTSYQKTFPSPDTTKEHTYEVVVEAWDDQDSENPRGWSKTFTGKMAACPQPPTPPAGSFTTECTATGAQADVGQLSEGGHEGGSFRLVSGSNFSVAVVSGQQDVQVPVSSTVKLVYVPGEGDSVVLDTKESPAACPPPPEEQLGKITVKKVLDGDPIGTDPVFTVRVDCPGTSYDQDLVLNEGNGFVAITTDIPSGTQCSLTEVNIPDGWNFEGWSTETDKEQRTTTVTVGVGTPPAVSASVENERRTGRVEIIKKIEGDPTGASTEFTVVLDCRGTAYDRTVVLNQGNDWRVLFRGIPSGIRCTVTEPTVPDGWTLKSISPDSFLVDSFDTITVVVTNERKPVAPPTTGVITVTKVLDGAASGASTRFTFDVDCPGTAHDQALVVDTGSASSASATTGQIPTGVTCTVTERDTPGWTKTSVVPANGDVAVGSTVTFTNKRQTTGQVGGLGIQKAVSPVASDEVVVEEGDVLTYTLTVTATGTLVQPNVVVTDYVPGSDPAEPSSGETTYVPGSAGCVGAGACSVTGPGADGLITWRLGDMAGGTSRQVTFQVTIDELAEPGPGQTVVADIVNVGSVQSDSTPKTGSNEVVTPVTKVGGVKEENPPRGEDDGTDNDPAVLPRTGSESTGLTTGVGVLLLLMGAALLAIGRPKAVRSTG